MVNRGSNDVLFSVTIKLRDSFESHVVALCGSASKNYLFALSTDDVTNIGSCLLTGYFRIPAELVGF